MTTRRRLLLFGLLAGLLALGAAWLLWPRSAITRENAAKIQVGMTMAEVEAILGGPARDESAWRVQYEGHADEENDQKIQRGLIVALVQDNFHDRDGAAWSNWMNGSGVIVVRFDDTGRVSNPADFLPVRRRDSETLIVIIRRWLRL